MTDLVRGDVRLMLLDTRSVYRLLDGNTANLTKPLSLRGAGRIKGSE